MRTKDSRTVLRGLGHGNVPRLPGGLRRKQQAYKAGQKTPSAIDLHREINALKKTDIPWAYEVSKCAMQEALRDLDNAFKHFFRKVALKKQGKHKGKCGYPKFKSKKRGRGSFRLDCPIHVFEDRSEER